MADSEMLAQTMIIIQRVSLQASLVRSDQDLGRILLDVAGMVGNTCALVDKVNAKVEELQKAVDELKRDKGFFRR